jgi:hypothetical protein
VARNNEHAESPAKRVETVETLRQILGKRPFLQRFGRALNKSA